MKLDKRKFINLAAFRTPGFLGSNGSFGFANFSSFDQQCENNGLNFSHGFRHNKSPVSLYLNNSNSPSGGGGGGNHCDNSDNFGYQNSNNNNNNNVQLNNKNLNNSGHKNYNSNNNSGEVNSRGNSPRDNYRVDSPTDKRADTCSPEETSRSFSSHRNDDIGSRSPLNHHNNDSLGSQSPENLSSSKSQSSSKKNNLNHSDMLDHKLQLSFLGPPLAALHSMTENSIMKSQNSPQTSQNSQCPTNPHGIDSILSRPTPVTSAHLNAALGGDNSLIKSL